MSSVYGREWGRSSVPMPVKSTQLVLPAAAEASSTPTLVRRRLAGPAGGLHESEVALAELVGVVSEPRIVADERFKGAFADIAGDERTPNRFLPPRSHPSSCMDERKEGEVITRKQLDGLRGVPSCETVSSQLRQCKLSTFLRSLTDSEGVHSRQGKCTELGREQLSRAQSHRRGEQRSLVAATRPIRQSLSPVHSAARV